jgi:arylformamidase
MRPMTAPQSAVMLGSSVLAGRSEEDRAAGPTGSPEGVALADVLARLQAVAATIEERLAQIEGMLREERKTTDERIAALARIASNPREALPAPDALAAPQSSAVDGSEPAAQIARLKAELVARERQLAEFEAVASGQIAALSRALSAIEDSTTWRVTGIVRSAVAALPQPARLALRRLARGFFWSLTPHRIPARLRWFERADRLTSKRLDSLNAAVPERLGLPLRRRYGPTPVEQLDIYRTTRPDAPIFVFIHGGAWRNGDAKNAAFPAEMFIDAGAHYVALDFAGIREVGGDLRIMVEQIRRGIAWVYRNAADFGGDRDRLFVGGHSSGGHLCGVALVSDWSTDFALPADLIKGGLLMSGLFDLGPVRRTKFCSYLRLTDEIEHAMSPQRHIEQLQVPVIITCGSSEAPEFKRQSRAFFAAVQSAGKPATLIEAANFGHLEMAESLASPYAPNGRASLSLMKLS